MKDYIEKILLIVYLNNNIDTKEFPLFISTPEFK